MQRKAETKIEEEDPTILIGSPMCRDWCAMLRVNWQNMAPGEKARRLEEARKHIEFVCRLYKARRLRGKYYLHEHPAQATSWDEPSIKKLQRDTQGCKTTFDMCQFGLISWDDEGKPKPAKNTTTVLTNMPSLQGELNRR